MCVLAQIIIPPREQVWGLNLREDMSGHEENPPGEGGWQGDVEKERLSSGKSSIERIIALHQINWLSRTNDYHHNCVMFQL